MPQENGECVVLVASGELGETIAMALAPSGFRILIARLGSETVSMYQEHQAEIDIVLLKYGPDLIDSGPPLANQRFSDGPATFDALCAINPNVRCVFMSGFCPPEEKVELMRRGAFGCVDMPFRLDELAVALRGCVEGRRFRICGTSDHMKRFLQRLASCDERQGDRLRVSDQKEQTTGDCWHNILTDPLTELPNRRAIIALAEQELHLWRTTSTPLAVIFLDIDGMAFINCDHGLCGGDALLVQLGELLASMVLPDEFVGRIAGDKFLVVACNTSALQAITTAEQLDGAIRQATFRYKESEMRITVGMGIALAEDFVTTTTISVMSATSEHLKRFLQRLLLDDEQIHRSEEMDVDPIKPDPLTSLPKSTAPISDPLTRLPNRRAIIALAEQEFQRWRTSSTPLALILFDVDGMRRINDQYLLLGGDVLLHQLAELLARTVSPDEFVGRFGGDRFLIVACNTNSFRAVAMAERLDEAVRQATFRYKEEEMRITISIGIAVAEDFVTPEAEFCEAGMSDELQGVVLAATERMYESKRRNRGLSDQSGR